MATNSLKINIRSQICDLKGDIDSLCIAISELADKLE